MHLLFAGDDDDYGDDDGRRGYIMHRKSRVQCEPQRGFNVVRYIIHIYVYYTRAVSALEDRWTLTWAAKLTSVTDPRRKKEGKGMRERKGAMIFDINTNPLSSSDDARATLCCCFFFLRRFFSSWRTLGAGTNFSCIPNTSAHATIGIVSKV